MWLTIKITIETYDNSNKDCMHLSNIRELNDIKKYVKDFQFIERAIEQEIEKINGEPFDAGCVEARPSDNSTLIYHVAYDVRHLQVLVRAEAENKKIELKDYYEYS